MEVLFCIKIIACIIVFTPVIYYILKKYVSNKNELIHSFNEKRSKKFLRIKYENMRKDYFKFYRATAHLFYHDIPSDSFLFNSPNVWVCGDMHFENFGSFHGDNGLVYFDLNDFDEAILAPCLMDVSRFLVSLILITERLKFKYPDGIKLCHIFLESYCNALKEGSSRVIEKESAKGVIKNLLKNLQNRESFIKEYTIKQKGIRRLNLDHPSIE